MPIYSDYSGLGGQSSSYFYYSPYSFKSRMSSALTIPSSPPPPFRPIPALSAAETSSSILSKTRSGYFYPARPISRDTATIDVTTPRVSHHSSAGGRLRNFAINSGNNGSSNNHLVLTSTTSASSVPFSNLRRGRTVVRLKTMKPKENPDLGKTLANKFIIPEKCSTSPVEQQQQQQQQQQETSLKSSANAGVIRRRVSNRRKSGVVPDESSEKIIRTDVENSNDDIRKCSISEEMLKEEEAIFDDLIREEMSNYEGRRLSEVTYEEVKRRNSVNRGKLSSFENSKSRKRYSVDISDMKRYSSLESEDQTLADFLKEFDKPHRRLHDVKAENEEIRTDEQQQLADDNKGGRTESRVRPNKPAPLSLNVASDSSSGSGPSLNKISYQVIVEESPERSPDQSIFTFSFTKKASIKAASSSSSSSTNKSDDTTESKLAKETDRTTDIGAVKQIETAAVASSGKKDVLKKKVIRATSSKVVEQVAVSTPSNNKIEINKKTTGVVKNCCIIKKPKAVKVSSNKTESAKGEKSKEKEILVSKKKKKDAEQKIASTVENKTPLNETVVVVVVDKNNNDVVSTENKTVVAEKTVNNCNIHHLKKRAKESKLVRQTAAETPDSNNNEENNKNDATVESPSENSAKKRRDINWKLVEVGRAEDFEDEITEQNGWIPSSEDEEEESSSDDSSSEEDDEDSSDSSAASSSYSPTKNLSSNDLNVDCMTLDGDNATSSTTQRRPYSYRHKIQHAHDGPVMYPATTIPRFKKYTVNDFNFLKVLGKGSFGKVLLAELRGTEYYYAVKCLKKDVVLEDDDVECTLIERKVLTLGSKHPYLCHLFCTFQSQSHLFFVMEYLNGGDLMFHIQKSGRFDEGRARFYAAEIITGLRFLHKKGIVYRDLKLDNILLDFEGHVRIADFGMCKLQIYLDRKADTFCGTPDYMAPEIIKGLKYNQSVDWWSFGILVYEMLIGQSPFSGCDEDQLFWSVCNEEPQYPRYLSPHAKSVLLALLEKDASKRIGSLGCNSGDDVMEHPFFSGMDWKRLERKELEPPYKPKVFHPLDTHYFDQHFTRERPRLTPIDKTILESIDQTQFHGFTYTNPNATDL